MISGKGFLTAVGKGSHFHKHVSIGELPISVTESVEIAAVHEATPPPLPPKLDDADSAEGASLLPPKPKSQPRGGSVKQPPPRPPKTT